MNKDLASLILLYLPLTINQFRQLFRPSLLFYQNMSCKNFDVTTNFTDPNYYNLILTEIGKIVQALNSYTNISLRNIDIHNNRYLHTKPVIDIKACKLVLPVYITIEKISLFLEYNVFNITTARLTVSSLYYNILICYNFIKITKDIITKHITKITNYVKKYFHTKVDALIEKLRDSAPISMPEIQFVEAIYIKDDIILIRLKPYSQVIIK